mgnify:FL=1
MGQERNLTPTQHWELHQGLWHMLGCDMKLKHKDRTKIIYVDNKSKRQYTYSALGFIKEKKL